MFAYFALNFLSYILKKVTLYLSTKYMNRYYTDKWKNESHTDMQTEGQTDRKMNR